MKKLIIISILILAIPLLATWNRSDALLDGTLGVLATATATNGAEFDSEEVIVYDTPFIGVTAMYNRAAGSALTVDFVFEVCYDGGSDGPALTAAHWATFNGTDIKIATETAAVTGTTVRVFYEIAVYGASHFRWKSVKNNDTANNITAVNVVVSK